MERLTEERGHRTWRFFRLFWYINLVIVILVLLLAGLVYYTETELSTVASLLVLAAVLLLGGGISRYQARLEGQHLELKLIAKKMLEELNAIKSVQKRTASE